ncbi:MAG: hypothetical protein ACFCAD_19300 [Pleurocapsa sp.]
MWLQALDNQKLLMHNRFNYHVCTLFDSLQAANFAPKSKQKANITIWFRLSQKHRWHHLTLPVIDLQPIKLKIF